MTLRLLLICHAPTEATRRARFADPGDLPEPSGLAAAQAVRGTPGRITRAVRGPEARCRATAEALGLDAAVPDDALADLDVGAWRGLPMDAAGPGLAAWLADPAAAPHGGEPVAALLERVASWLEARPEGPERVAAVTHPAVVRAAVLHVLGAPARAFWRLDAAPLSQTRLSRSGGRWRLRETGHAL
ncbi:histidine phosphatase family protein [Actinomadura parmotrematis]|uniref:histidine phosphatase family protein n=1 Tax=Actinomadura parmotrematis TaxID=2864039 RepID=UPI0027E33C8A|nr:histidine phosphatase family protein [Actinomadura parmotrematis]